MQKSALILDNTVLSLMTEVVVTRFLLLCLLLPSLNTEHSCCQCRETYGICMGPWWYPCVWDPLQIIRYVYITIEHSRIPNY